MEAVDVGLMPRLKDDISFSEPSINPRTPSPDIELEEILDLKLHRWILSRSS